MVLEEEEEDDNHQQLQLSNTMEVSPESSSPESVLSRKVLCTLPKEIIIEVLLRLPVESLLRCKSVCKLWYSLISDPHFVTSHLTYNLYAHRKLIFSLGQSPTFQTCDLYDVMNDNLFNALEVVDCPLKLTSNLRVVGSCNGLLCIYNGDDGIVFLWNPSTRTSYTLPSHGYKRHDVSISYHYGFGYEESSNDYKVVEISSTRIERHKYETFVRMYSLINGSWKDIGPHVMEFDHIGTFLNGAFHWAAYSDHWNWTIVSLDLATEIYGEISIPLYDEGEWTYTLGTLGEWLSVLCDYTDIRVDLWVMKVYGDKDYWTKLVSVPYMPDPEDYIFVPSCISNDGRIVFTFGKELIIYNSKNKSLSDVKNFDEWVEALTFVESLVSPMPPATALEHRVAGIVG